MKLVTPSFVIIILLAVLACKLIPVPAETLTVPLKAPVPSVNCIREDEPCDELVNVY